MKNTCILTLLSIGFALGGSPALAQQGGSLEPPGAPGPTMRTLDDIGQAADAAIDPRTPIAAEDLPYTIDQPGSYYFTEDMLFTEASGNAISITSSNVTLDLMGFALRSTPEVTGDGVWIVGGGLSNIKIRNGHISGRTNVGIDGAGDLTASKAGFRYGIHFGSAPARSVGLESLYVSRTREGGILANVGGVIESCGAYSNGGIGIEASESNVKNCIARRNTGTGISAQGGMVSYSIARKNGGDGIYARNGIVSHSVARENASHGISASSGSVTHSVARENGSHGISSSSGSVSHSTARGNGSIGISAGTGSVINSTAYSNDGDGIEGSYGVVAFCKASNNGGTEIDAYSATSTGNNPTP